MRVAATTDTPACSWCSPPPTGSGTITLPIGVPFPSSIPKVNALGQILIDLEGWYFIGGKDGSLVPVPVAPSGACGPPVVSASPGTGSFFGGVPVGAVLFIGTLSGNALLNDAGAVAFLDNAPSTTTSTFPSSTICFVAQGGSTPAAVASTGSGAPASLGGTYSGFTLSALNEAGDILFQSPISGGTTPFALLRYSPSSTGGQGQFDAVAYNGEVVAGTPSETFASPTFTGPSFIVTGGVPTITNITLPTPAFSAASMAKNGRVSFTVLLTRGVYAVYQQSGANPPMLVALGGNATPVSGAGTYEFSPLLATETLDLTLPAAAIPPAV